MTEADAPVVEARGSVPATVAIIALAAPGIGAVLLTFMVLWRQILAMPEFLGMILMLLPAAYLVGIAPALLTGLAAVRLSPRIANGRLWSGAVAVIGAVLTVTAVILLDPTGGHLNPLGALKLGGPPAAVAFLLCALACSGLKLRPR